MHLELAGGACGVRTWTIIRHQLWEAASRSEWTEVTGSRRWCATPTAREASNQPHLTTGQESNEIRRVSFLRSEPQGMVRIWSIIVIVGVLYPMALVNVYASDQTPTGASFSRSSYFSNKTDVSRMSPMNGVKQASSCLYLRCGPNEGCCPEAPECVCSGSECQCR